jgi:hypothetical protein
VRHRQGVKRIAKTLNGEGVAAAPRPQRGRPRAWAPSSVRAVLHREAYRGVYVYNATRQSDNRGQRTGEKRRDEEVVRTLRRVDDNALALAWMAAVLLLHLQLV